MVTTYLQGGLGNYMFQIAAAKSLSIDLDCDVIFNESKATTVHQPIHTYKDNIFRNIKFTNEDVNTKLTHQEIGFEYNEIPMVDDVLLSGYFQSEKYFIKNKDKIKEVFKPSDNDKKYIKDRYGDLTNTCSIHIRRGDYISQQQNHPLCKESYYEEALKYIPKGTKFLVFSDDIKWCENIFKGDSFIFVENELDYMDMYIMSMCKHNIIANSTFSWWGAWLNNNKNRIVIAPSIWFGVSKQLNTKDIIPNGWIKI